MSLIQNVSRRQFLEGVFTTGAFVVAAQVLPRHAWAQDPAVRVVPVPGVVQQAASKLASAERPLLVVGSQALVDAGQADAVAEAIETLGIPVYLSGMALGLLGAAQLLGLHSADRELLRCSRRFQCRPLALRMHRE